MASLVRTLLLTAVSLLPLAAARAQQAPNSADPTPAQTGPASQVAETPATQLDAINVTANRGPRTLNDTAATVSVIDSQEIDRRNVQTPREAVRLEPGVSVGNQPTRGGATNYVIRGIGDNRVRVQIDNIRVPDFPSTNIGAGTYTRDFVDLENVKRIEIVRGPASALYGSDAVGGIVAYTTKDPADYLDLFGKDGYVSRKTAFDGVDSSLNSTTTAAVRVGNVEALVLYTHRTGNEVRPNGGVDPNPQDFFADSVLGKLVWHVTPVDTLRLTGEFSRRTLRTNIRTDLAVMPGVGVHLAPPSWAAVAGTGRSVTASALNTYTISPWASSTASRRECSTLGWTAPSTRTSTNQATPAARRCTTGCACPTSPSPKIYWAANCS